jgi:hypothetical protein
MTGRMAAVLWVAMGLVIGAVIPALAQSEGQLECGSLVTWHSSCDHPMFDVDAHHGARGVREAQIEFAEYQSCLTRQAQDDAQAVSKSIFEEAAKERNEVEHEAAIWGFSIQ